MNYFYKNILIIVILGTTIFAKDVVCMRTLSVRKIAYQHATPCFHTIKPYKKYARCSIDPTLLNDMHTFNEGQLALLPMYNALLIKNQFNNKISGASKDGSCTLLTPLELFFTIFAHRLPCSSLIKKHSMHYANAALLTRHLHTSYYHFATLNAKVLAYYAQCDARCTDFATVEPAVKKIIDSYTMVKLLHLLLRNPGLFNVARPQSHDPLTLEKAYYLEQWWYKDVWLTVNHNLLQPLCEPEIVDEMMHSAWMTQREAINTDHAQ